MFSVFYDIIWYYMEKRWPMTCPFSSSIDSFGHVQRVTCSSSCTLFDESKSECMLCTITSSLATIVKNLDDSIATAVSEFHTLQNR